MDTVPFCAGLELKAVPLVGVPRGDNVFDLFDLIGLHQSAGSQLPPALISALNPPPQELLLTTHIYDCTDLSEKQYETYDVSVHFHPYVFQEVALSQYNEAHVKVGVFRLDADFAQSMVKEVDTDSNFLLVAKNSQYQLQEVTVTVKTEDNRLNCTANKYKLRISACLPVVVFYTMCFVGDGKQRAAVTRHILLIDRGDLGRSIALLAISNNQSVVRDSLCSTLLDLPRSVTDWTNASEFLWKLTEMCSVTRKEQTQKELRSFLCFVAWKEKGSPEGDLNFGASQLEKYEKLATGNNLPYGLQRLANRAVAEILHMAELVSPK